MITFLLLSLIHAVDGHGKPSLHVGSEFRASVKIVRTGNLSSTCGTETCQQEQGFFQLHGLKGHCLQDWKYKNEHRVTAI